MSNDNVEVYIESALAGLTPGPARDCIERAQQQVEQGRYKMASRYLGRSLTMLHTQQSLERVALAYAVCVARGREGWERA